MQQTLTEAWGLEEAPQEARGRGRASQDPPRARDAPDHGPGSTLRQGTVLVVDDDPLHRFLIRAALEEAIADDGRRVLEAPGGAEALDVLRALREDEEVLVITDQRMPGMDGCELVGRSRGLPGGPRRRHVLLTSMPDLQRMPAVDEVALKPVRAERLRPLVDRLLRDWAGAA